MTVAIVGLGLIGGSVARDLRRTGFATHLTGVEKRRDHADEALRLGLVDAIAPLEEAVAVAELVVLATPMDALLTVLPRVLDHLADDATALDLGSVKLSLVSAVATHPRRHRYVATHPMAGTENAGPSASLPRLFEGKVAILCDPEATAVSARATAEAFYAALGMRIVTMTAAEHDHHAAWLSHAPHVVAYALALAALREENDSRMPFDLAGGGFASMVRVAQSAPEMWVPILLQNRSDISEAIQAISHQLLTLREAVENGDETRLRDLIAQANRIRSALWTNAIKPVNMSA